MASIFTYDPDPPRVSSPWLTPRDSGASTPQSTRRFMPSNGRTPPPGLLSDYSVTKLEPEPQLTSTEYKLHLLLRPRRMYSSTSTSTYISGSQQARHPSRRSDSSHEPNVTPAPSSQSRQNRLHQLTTQLFWRLQQSSPYHATSSSDLVLPKLSEATQKLEAPSRPGKLLAGLAESRGALYEIGVSDDGTFIGLTEDEMEESLTNLRAMAASLGCNVEVTRMVLVGDCKWTVSPSEEATVPPNGMDISHSHPEVKLHQANLWVAEALVAPDLTYEKGNQDRHNLNRKTEISSPSVTEAAKESKAITTESSAEQVRITLTGPTTSGKSSLLGTLSTATLDNGRGKSRLSLLKHRHELASGVTSSVAQELFGYNSSTAPGSTAEVINFAAGNVTSWTDIHASVEDGRLVFVCDSAGHPRYRRTTVRGMIGWAPHWTLLCVAADDGENAPSGAGGTSSAKDILGLAGAGIDLAKAHLDLCLKLEKPLVIVITKLDLASKPSLRQTLTKILSAVKGAFRVPAMLPADQTKNILDSDLEVIPTVDTETVQKIVDSMDKANLKTVVPIIMTSAAKGTGIRLLHALLHALPIPPTPTSRDYVANALNPEQPACLFHVEDVFGFPAAYIADSNGHQLDSGTVVAGHLRFGKLSMGDNIIIGPFPADLDEFSSSDRLESRTPPIRSKYRSFPGRFEMSEYSNLSASNPSSSELNRIASRGTVSASVTAGEWHNAHIVSIRNLRLPVNSLEAGQVGTIGIVFDLPEQEISNGPFERPPLQAPRIRKGMVLAVPSKHMLVTKHTLQAASGFTAAFEDGDINSVTIGSLVVVYVASVRASARVVKMVPHSSPNKHNEAEPEIKDNGEEDDLFGLDDTPEREEETVIFGTDGVTDVTLELLTNREWIELGSQVLIMPGGGHGLYYGSERGKKGVAGLEGFVGRVLEVAD